MEEELLRDQTRDALLEWVYCHWPCALEEEHFLRGLWFITDGAIRDAAALGWQRALMLAEPSVN